MIVTARAVSPGDVEIEISVRMPLRDWKNIAVDLRASSESYTGTELGRAIQAALLEMDKQWSQEVPAK
jgi:hypothetical protein